MSSIEMHPIQHSYPPSRDDKTNVDESTSPPIPPSNTDAEYWAWGVASILAFTSILLLVFPRILLLVSNDTDIAPRATLTPLEGFLASHLALGLFAFSLSLVMGIPSTHHVAPAASKDSIAQHPLLVPLTISLTLSSIVSYNYNDVGAIGALTCFSSGAGAIWGVYVILFGGQSFVSKKTGADKHTSRFLFGNKAAASAQKKEWKEEQRRKGLLQ